MLFFAILYPLQSGSQFKYSVHDLWFIYDWSSDISSYYLIWYYKNTIFLSEVNLHVFEEHSITSVAEGISVTIEFIISPIYELQTMNTLL